MSKKQITLILLTIAASFFIGYAVAWGNPFPKFSFYYWSLTVVGWTTSSLLGWNLGRKL